MVKRRRIISAREPLGSLVRYGNIYIETKIMGKRITLSEEERNHISNLHTQIILEDKDDRRRGKDIETENINKLNQKLIVVLNKFDLNSINGLSEELGSAGNERETHKVGATLIKTIMKLNSVLATTLTHLTFNTLDIRSNSDAVSYYKRALNGKPDIEHMLGNIKKLFKLISKNKRTNNETKEKLREIGQGIKSLTELSNKINKRFIAYSNDPGGKKIEDLNDLFRRYQQVKGKGGISEQRVSRDKKTKQKQSEEPKPIIHTTYDDFMKGNIGDYYKIPGSREAARKQHPELQNSTKYPLVQLEDGSYGFKKAQ